jgi:hypothetical protein
MDTFWHWLQIFGAFFAAGALALGALAEWAAWFNRRRAIHGERARKLRSDIYAGRKP